MELGARDAKAGGMMATRGWEKATPNDVRHRRPLTTMPQKARSKYNAVKTTVDGITFHSLKEANRYRELELLQRAGKIARLKLQPRFSLFVTEDAYRNGHGFQEPRDIEIGAYVADFEYDELSVEATRRVVEDVKGFKTPLYRWKKKHVEAQYGIVIREL